MSQKLSGFGRPRSGLEWQEEHRFVLMLLCGTWQLTPKDRASVFNTIFSDDLKKCNKPEGQTGGSLSSQWGERDNPKKIKNWRKIFQEPATTRDRERRVALEDQVIETIIRVTGRQPVHKASTAPSRATSRTRATTPPQDTPHAIALIRAAAYVPPASTPTKRPFDAIDQFNDSDEDPQPAQKSRQRLTPQHRSVSRARTEMSAGESDDEYVPTTDPVTPARRGRQLVDVFIPHSTDPRAPITPSQRSSASKRRRSASRPRDLLPKFTVSREHGPDLQVTAAELEVFHGPATPITVEDAFPPTPSLLFRYWDETSQGSNTEQGFVAGRYHKNNMPIKPAPHPSDLDLSDLYTHFSRDEIATPFISTSCFLLWIIRLGVKQMHEGKKLGKITVIDPAQLPPKSFYFSRPCHKATLYKRPYISGQHMYGGACEFLVWHRIPQKAVMHTFSIRQLVDLTNDNAVFGTIMQLPTLTLHRVAYSTKILRMLKETNNTLTPENIGAVAQMVLLTGLNHESSVAHVSHVVGDILRGLGFIIERLKETDWQRKSAIFAHAIAKQSDLPPTLSQQENLRLAFLHGVVWSRGGWTWGPRMRDMNIMWQRASRLGLGSPATVLANEMAVARSDLVAFDEHQQRTFPVRRAQALLEDGIEDDDEQEALTVDVASMVLGSSQTRQDRRGQSADEAGMTSAESVHSDASSEQIIYE